MASNPFAQFAPTTAAPAPAAAPQDNPFSKFAQPAAPPPDAPAPDADAAPEMEQWSTKIGHGADARVVSWYAPKGADYETVRALGTKAGVDRVGERSILAGKDAPDRLKGTAAQEQSENSYGTLGTALENGVHFVMPFVDRIASGLDTLVHGGDYSDKVNYLHDRLDNSYENHTTAGRVGDAGMTALTLPLAIESKIGQGGNWLMRSLKAGAGGSAISSAFNYGNNRPEDPFNGAGPAALLGFGLGFGTPTAGKLVGAAASRLDERLGVSDKAKRAYSWLMGHGETGDQAATRQAITAFANRTAQDPNTMAQRAGQFRAADVDPTLVNVVDEAGRGQIAAAARRAGPGREVAQRAAEAKALNMPDAIDRQMQSVILNGTTDPALRQQLSRNSSQMLDDLTDTRSNEMDADMAPARNDHVPLTPEMISALDTAEGRTAINRAVRTVQDPDMRQQMQQLPSMLRSLNSLDPRMPQSARDQIISQVTKGATFNVDMADRLARKFNAMADTADKDAAPVLRQFARTMRDSAKASSPGYATALDNYAARSRSRDAVGVGEDFLKPDTDNFVKDAGRLSDEPNRPREVPAEEGPPSPFSEGDDVATPGGLGTVAGDHPVPGHTQVTLDSGQNVHVPHDQVSPLAPPAPADIDGDAARFAELPPTATTPPEARQPLPPTPDAPTIAPEPPAPQPGPAVVPTPTNRQLASMGARRAVQRAVGENTSAAPGIARKIAVAPEQATRTNALLGPLKAEELRNRMAITAEDVRNFADIAPRTGSATALRIGDDAAAGQILEAAASAKSGRFGNAITMLKNLGMRDQDAHQLVKVAVDPARTDELISILSRNMQSRQKAAQLARTISNVAQASTGTELSGSR